MTSRDDALEILSRIGADDGPRATDDPAVAQTNRPCVLVGPPTSDYTDKSRTWGLLVLSDKDVWTLDAWSEIEAIADQVCTRLPIEAATPTAYGAKSIPALTLRLVTTI
jgi:hypothetical protein